MIGEFVVHLFTASRRGLGRAARIPFLQKEL